MPRTMTKKGGQIAIFSLMAMVIFIAVSFLFFTTSNAAKTKSQLAFEKTSKSGFEINAVKIYFESCLKKSAEKAIFQRIGPQGGYISTSGQELSRYYDAGTVDFYTGTGDSFIHYDNYEVPYYLDGFQSSLLPKEHIEKKSSRYIFVEFLKCTNITVTENLGFKIKTPDTENILQHLKDDFSNSIFNITVNVNTKSISIKLHYPITIIKNDFKADISDFGVTLPIYLGEIYNHSNKLISNIKQHNKMYKQYNITQDCNVYNVNDFTNVYYKPITVDSGVIQFVDFSTYYNNYFKAFIFQFAVKNVDVTGFCTG